MRLSTVTRPLSNIVDDTLTASTISATWCANLLIQFCFYCVVLLSFRWLFSAIITCYRAEKSLVFSLSHGFPLTITNHLRKQSKCAVSFLRLVVLGEGDVRRGAWGLARCCQPETDSRQRLAQLRNPPRSTGWVNEGRYDLIQPQPKLNMNNKALQVISESFSRSFVF